MGFLRRSNNLDMNGLHVIRWARLIVARVGFY
jgi:hypothetical protein